MTNKTTTIKLEFRKREKATVKAALDKAYAGDDISDYEFEPKKYHVGRTHIAIGGNPDEMEIAADIVKCYSDLTKIPLDKPHFYDPMGREHVRTIMFQGEIADIRIEDGMGPDGEYCDRYVAIFPTGDEAINWEMTKDGWQSHGYTHGGTEYRDRCNIVHLMQDNDMKKK